MTTIRIEGPGVGLLTWELPKSITQHIESLPLIEQEIVMEQLEGYLQKLIPIMVRSATFDTISFLEDIVIMMNGLTDTIWKLADRIDSQMPRH